MTTETRLLQMLGHGAPMLEVLNELCKFIDDESPGGISTVFLLDGDGLHLRPVAGPKAPAKWREEIEGLELGMYAGFCSAEGQGTLQTVSVNSDDLVAAYRQAAVREGLQIASFQPILSAEKKILGALALAYPERHLKPDPGSDMMERAVHLAAIAIECYRNEQELRDFSRRLSQSQDDERRRIGRELHDSTGQKLAALSMNLAMVANRSSAEAGEVKEMISDCGALAKDISEEIRTLSYLLHPPLLDVCGLESALQMYLRGINVREGLEVELEVPRRLERLSDEAELAVFRIVQASLTNIHLHSGSRAATIKIGYVNEGLAITIRDQGRGIPAGVLDGSTVDRGRGAGVGIVGMRERMLQLGGRLEIESGEYGTRVRAIIPKRHFRKTGLMTAAAS